MTKTNSHSERGASAPWMVSNSTDDAIKGLTPGLTPPARESALPRREFLATTTALAAGLWAAPRLFGADDKPEDPALIAITLDLEMSREYPTKDQTHWDYQKGNLNAETKQYAVEAASRVKAHGGVLHFFAVGQVFEQENVDWMKEIAEEGHPIGNHTYDHVYLLATKPEDLQFRFRRAPWLIEGKMPSEVIEENIRLCTTAMKMRLGKKPRWIPYAGRIRTRPERSPRYSADADRFEFQLGQQPLSAAQVRPLQRGGAGGRLC